MTPTQQALWSRVQRRAGNLSGNLSSLILKAHQRIAENYSDVEIARLIANNQIDQVIERAFSDTILDAAYAPVRERMRQGVFDSVSYFAKTELPSPPKGTLNFAFDYLSPDVVKAVRELQTGAMEVLKGETRDTVRQAILDGLQAGETPSAIAKGLRDKIGLTKYQLQVIENYRSALERGAVKKAESYRLRDKRLKISDEMTKEQIEKSVAAYRKRLVAHNADNIAKDTALKAQKLGQRLSWESAIRQGIVSRERLMKQRIGVNDDRERPEHVAINDQVRPFDATYSNGEMWCGEIDWGCRCVDRYFQARN